MAASFRLNTIKGKNIAPRGAVFDSQSKRWIYKAGFLFPLFFRARLKSSATYSN